MDHQPFLAHARPGDLGQHGRAARPPYVEGGGSARTLRKIHAPYTAIKTYMQNIGGNPTYEKAM